MPITAKDVEIMSTGDICTLYAIAELKAKSLELNRLMYLHRCEENVIAENKANC